MAQVHSNEYYLEIDAHQRFLSVCYLYMFMMLVNYKFEVPIFDYGYTAVRESVSFFFSTMRTVEDKMFLMNKETDGGSTHNNV